MLNVLTISGECLKRRADPMMDVVFILLGQQKDQSKLAAVIYKLGSLTVYRGRAEIPNAKPEATINYEISRLQVHLRLRCAYVR
ncbi:unnamed protein product [Dibothriocephalus latus]|uniref:Uncharacterized protein n=1 Tax=Dibothriocephalus latus TaxID=60516 RepID=A0A3P7P3I6_DIBLA|nr:unnamed protein product [Dibothriocephalus latus]